jgi:hypothetical protein
VGSWLKAAVARKRARKENNIFIWRVIEGKNSEMGDLGKVIYVRYSEKNWWFPRRHRGYTENTKFFA